MRKFHILLAMLALLLMSCSDPAPGPTLSEGPEQSATAVTSTTEPSASSPTSSTAPAPATTPAPSTTDSTEPESMWPAGPPGRYALFEDGMLSVVDGTESYETSEVAEAPTEGGFVDDVLVFSVGCCDAIWAWDYVDSGVTDRLASGQDDEHVTLHGVASGWEQPGFFYTTGGAHPGDAPDLMFYDLGTGEPRRFVDMSERRPGLTEEEQSASVGRVVATEDRVGILFAFGDGTWVEWYTDTGEPAESPFEGIDQGDTVLELALAPDGDLAVGREEGLHHGITLVDVVTTDGEVRSYSVPDQQSLRHIQFDGQYVTASVHSIDPPSSPAGPPERVILDVDQNQFSYSPGPTFLAVGAETTE